MLSKFVKKQLGFTLIELITVLIILGIISITVAPKFIRISDDSIKASNSYLVSSFKQALNLLEMKATVSKVDPNGVITVGTIQLKLFKYWPECGIGDNDSQHCTPGNAPNDGLSDTNECRTIWEVLMRQELSQYTVLGDHSNGYVCEFRLRRDNRYGFDYQALNRTLVEVTP